MQLTGYKSLVIKQKFEGLELLGYESRNKYAIMDENENKIGFAAEQQKGILGFLLRHLLGHWRKFDVHFFNEDKNEFMSAHHPFRFFFQRFEITDIAGEYQGALQQRFSILNKKFDVLDKNHQVIFRMRSPFWKIWTFPFFRHGDEVARVAKKWTGLMAEAFTDKDTFVVEYANHSLNQEERLLILATSIFIDLQYFERKAS